MSSLNSGEFDQTADETRETICLLIYYLHHLEFCIGVDVECLLFIGFTPLIVKESSYRSFYRGQWRSEIVSYSIK